MLTTGGQGARAGRGNERRPLPPLPCGVKGRPPRRRGPGAGVSRGRASAARAARPSPRHAAAAPAASGAIAAAAATSRTGNHPRSPPIRPMPPGAPGARPRVGRSVCTPARGVDRASSRGRATRKRCAFSSQRVGGARAAANPRAAGTTVTAAAGPRRRRQAPAPPPRTRPRWAPRRLPPRDVAAERPAYQPAQETRRGAPLRRGRGGVEAGWRAPRHNPHHHRAPGSDQATRAVKGAAVGATPPPTMGKAMHVARMPQKGGRAPRGARPRHVISQIPRLWAPGPLLVAPPPRRRRPHAARAGARRAHLGVVVPDEPRDRGVVVAARRRGGLGVHAQHVPAGEAPDEDAGDPGVWGGESGRQVE
jgi:hypothetical protein